MSNKGFQKMKPLVAFDEKLNARNSRLITRQMRIDSNSPPPDMKEIKQARKQWKIQMKQEEKEIKRKKTEELRREERLRQEEDDRKLEQLRTELQLKLQIKQDEEENMRRKQEENLKLEKLRAEQKLKLQMKEEEDIRREKKLRKEEENRKLNKFLTNLKWINIVHTALGQQLFKYEPGPYSHLFKDRVYDIVPRDTPCQHVENCFDFSQTKIEAEEKARVVSGGMDPVLDDPHRDGERFHYHPHDRCYVRIKSEPFKLYNFHFVYGSTCAKVDHS